MLKDGFLLKSVPVIAKAGHPLSEYDIITLHRTFLTPGYHHLRVSSCKQGRDIIYQILASMKYYQQVACLTKETLLLSDYVIDLYEDITIQTNNVDEYFLHHFSYDFLWIELSSTLDVTWIDQFYNALNDFNLEQKIPILCIASN